VTGVKIHKLVDFSRKTCRCTKNLQMHKKLANTQNICKSTKFWAVFHVGIVVISKNLQMHKILANRQIIRFLTKYLRINKTSDHRRSLTTPPTMVSSGCASPASTTSGHCPSPPAFIAFDMVQSSLLILPSSNSPDQSSTTLFNHPDIPYYRS
jgi:hypothetical protein